MKNYVCALALGASLLASACLTTEAPPGEASLGVDNEGLYLSGGVLWTKNALSVCWESAPSSQATARQWAKDAVLTSWGKKSGLAFTGWSACGPSGADVRIAPGDERSYVQRVGSPIQNLASGMVLNLDFVAWGDRCSCSAQGVARESQLRAQHPGWTDDQVYAQCRVEFSAEACVRSTAVHEFGHVLGFSHEQDRSDHPASCPADAGFVNGSDDIYVGAFDPQSVMNYCNPHYNNFATLSVSDADGARIPYGWGGDQPVPGDYDGNGKSDYALFRPSTGTWYIINTAGDLLVGASGVAFGQVGDVPVPGDYDGDGKDDLAVWRPSTGEWFARRPDGTIIAWAITYGVRGDVPVPGDFDGDGKNDLALWRPATGEWFARKVSGAALLFSNTVWGVAGDVPLAGDFNADGKDDLVIWRPSEGRWHIRTAAGTLLYQTYFGANGDVPMLADYNGDGHPDLGVWRPSNATWYGKTASGDFIFSTVWGQAE